MLTRGWTGRCASEYRTDAPSFHFSRVRVDGVSGGMKPERGRALRQVSAIDLSVRAEELDGGDVRLEQLADLADALVEQVGAVRAHYEQLQRTLEEPAPDAPVTDTVGGERP